MNESTAYLSNNKDYISFTFNGRTIRFKGPYSLTRFAKVKDWDNGYLVVDAFYAHSKEAVEDYIDLAPILKDLYIDSQSFLKSIKKWRSVMSEDQLKDFPAIWQFIKNN